MRNWPAGLLAVIVLAWTALAATSGCSFQPSKPPAGAFGEAPHYKNVALEMEYPKEPVPERQDDFAAYAPHVIREGPPEYWDLTLEEAL